MCIVPAKDLAADRSVYGIWLRVASLVAQESFPAYASSANSHLAAWDGTADCWRRLRRPVCVLEGMFRFR